MENKLQFNLQDNTLYIARNFLNNTWFENFGEIQNSILTIKDEKIIVNMERTAFISPTPFLSLLLTLKKIKEENRCVVEIILPEDKTTDGKKLLNFCSREGFMDIINCISERKYSVSEANAYNVVGNENFENILKARIFSLKAQENNIQEIVNTIIGQINENNLNINKSQKLYITITIRNILQELIDNVDKHAYAEGNKYIALYIRMRYSTDATMRIGRVNNSYEKLPTTTKPDEVYVHNGIELYFQDIGKGIIKSYEEKGKIYPNRPLREIVKDAFFKEKFENRDNNTPVNGLAFLRKIIQEKNNFFCVYNELEGTGNFGINDKKMNVNNINMNDFKEKKEPVGIKGQIYNFTLFDRKYPLLEKEFQEPKDDLLNIYCEPYRKIYNPVIDLRVSTQSKKYKGIQDLILLFVPEYLTKNAIINMLRKILEESDGIRKLIICDIEDEELVLFEFALKNLIIFSIDEKRILKEIYIATKSLKIKHFVNHTNWKFVQEKMSFKAFNEKFSYLYRMKVYESEYLANVLENNMIGKYILTKGNIEWSNGEIMDGFINFDMLSSNDLCFDLLLRNLKRILPIIGERKLHAIDSVVERLVDAVNAFTDKEKCQSFGVGSIVVSGLTLQSSDYSGNTIHFFSRGKGTKLPALFFDPVYLYRAKEKTQRITYVRVGKSSRIKFKDRIEEKRNTNSYLEEKEMYKILHQYAYSSVLCGHLNFEKRHDLLTINLDAIMYDKNTMLQNYVKNIIHYGLGHYFEEELEDNTYFDNLKNASLIVYPYNQFTASIFKMSGMDEKYRKYVVGLSPINITNQGENLGYSECFTEYINEIVESYRKKYPSNEIKVIIFDSLSYSGKTKQEIYEYLLSIVDVQPCYVSVIDARVNHYAKQNNTFNYINLNIPLLGKSETCKICLVLNKLSVFKNNIIDADILSTIEDMEKIWKVRDIRNYKEIIKLPNFDRIYAKNILLYNMSAETGQDDLYFINALPLYIFITNRIKIENDYSALEFIYDNYRDIIGKDSMAYIMTLFLFEYGKNVYHSLLKKSVIYLLTYLMDSKDLNVRKFVSLALFTLDDEKLIEMVFEFIQNNKSSMQMTNEGQIVLMYCLNKRKAEKGFERFAFLYNKMKSGNNRLDLYKQFHCQLKNTNGNVHNSPLKSLVNGENSIENKRLTLASLLLFEESLKCVELTFDILYEEGRGIEQTNSDIEITYVREKCLQEIEEVKKIIYTSKDSEGIKDKIKNIFDCGEELHKKLFAPYIVKRVSENRNLVSITSLLSDRIDFYNDKIVDRKDVFPVAYDQAYKTEINVSKDVVTIYYIWNNMLVREIDYILDNLGKFVNEQQAVKIDGQLVSGQIQIEITAAEFIVNIYNNTNDTIDNIRKSAKQRYQKEVLSMLGVKFEYCKNNHSNKIFDENAVITKIIIPNIQNIREV